MSKATGQLKELSNQKMNLPNKEEIKSELILNRYKEFLKDICGNELSIKYLKTKEGKDSMGSEKAKEEIKNLEENNKEAEKKLKFLEGLLKVE